MASRRSGRRLPARVAPRHAGTAPSQKPLFKAKDHGAGVTLDPEVFAPAQRGGGWGPFAESFLRLNESSLAKLDVKPEIGSSDAGVRVRLVPGGRAGAIPLRSAQTGHVGGGLVVEPRFGWSGVGNVLSLTGWAAAPEFLEGPLVPGSGREVPPWGARRPGARSHRRTARCASTRVPDEGGDPSPAARSHPMGSLHRRIPRDRAMGRPALSLPRAGHRSAPPADGAMGAGARSQRARDGGRSRPGRAAARRPRG